MRLAFVLLALFATSLMPPSSAVDPVCLAGACGEIYDSGDSCFGAYHEGVRANAAIASVEMQRACSPTTTLVAVYLSFATPVGTARAGGAWIGSGPLCQISAWTPGPSQGFECPLGPPAVPPLAPLLP